MCASYGLDPRFTDSRDILAGDEAMLEALRTWAADNDGETLRPTGKIKRNLNPIITAPDGARRLERGWWGYLVNGEPAKFPSINSRSERLSTGRGPLPPRALVPATRWFEMQKPQRAWHEFATGELFAMAAVTRPGRTADGEEHTCYSIVMQDAPDRLTGIHDRSPVLVPHDFADEWLTSGAPAAELIDEAVSLSRGVLEGVSAAEMSGRP
ncbi:SOS response-associated peptidase family protein [Microbacterium halophytorum]|uniref:SOS response-associated peptidase family protein n=1 Tax=Microbacterium halophytorum TaxID=2067568 RepID=UPI000CFC9CBE|nr:SOS response-associated peptidase family protein [Microbacterium halophytorum]